MYKTHTTRKEEVKDALGEIAKDIKDDGGVQIDHSISPFDLYGNNPQRIMEIYERNVDNPNPNIDDVLDLISMFTLKKPVRYLHPSLADFYLDTVRSIRTGSWTMLPYMWASHITANLDLRLSSADEQRMSKAIFDECRRLSEELKVPNGSPKAVRQIALHWVKGDSYGFAHNGFQNMLLAAKVFVDMNSILSKGQ